MWGKLPVQSGITRLHHWRHSLPRMSRRRFPCGKLISRLRKSGSSLKMWLQVGIEDDQTCTFYEFCDEGARVRPDVDPVQCQPGLRFDRVSGVCDLEANVLCPGGIVGGASCTAEDGTPITGDVDSPASCDAFVTCIAGVAIGEFSCGRLHFNPATSQCDLPANLSPPCTATLDHKFVKKAPHFRQPKTLRERFMKKLHL